MTIREAVHDFIAQHQLVTEVIAASKVLPEQISIAIQGQNGMWEVRLLCYEEDRLLIGHLNFAIKIPEENREKISLLLSQINLTLKVGCFMIDQDSGNILTRVSQYIYGNEEDMGKQVEQVIKIISVISDSYYRDIMKVAFD